MVKRFLLLLTAVLGVILLATGTAAAGPVTIKDDSHVLDQAKVTDAANQLPDPVQIFTTEKFSDNRAKFDAEAQSHVQNTTDVVLAINTKSHFFSIRTGTDSHIRDASPALTAFKNSFGTNDYTDATIASLNALKTAADQPAPSRAGAPAPAAAPKKSHGGFGWLGLLCPIIVIAGIVALVVSLIRRRRGPRGPGGFGGPGGYGPGYGGPGGPGYGAPGYDPNYGPGGYAPRPGMSPGAAAGLGAVGGAVGGGLLGYELGRMEGEREERRDDNNYGYDPNQQWGGDQGQQQWGGGGGDTDFGGGGSDFGGGDSGGGGDFGGDSGGGGDGSF